MRFRSLITVGTLLVGSVIATVAVSPTASAAIPGVLNPTASMPSADALPTAQIDGVVWQQAIVGTTVYAGGSFGNARPAGAAPGTSQVARTNLLAYSLTTGVLSSTFAPNLNGQVRAVTASPDGSRIYVGGDFTTVNGITKTRIAAFSTANGQLITAFDANVNYTVRAIVATNTTVYAAGGFTSSRGTTRNRLAAFSASNGALLAWNPSADATVNAMVLTSDGSRIIVGGAFQNVGGTAAYGLAAVSPTAGARMSWNAANTVRDAGSQAAILSLTTDAGYVYGSGYVYGAGGNLEGAFKADQVTGNIAWIEDCHGDTYDTSVAGGVLYTVSHAHFCSDIGGFTESTPRSTNMRHALAFTTATAGTVGHNGTGNYYDWYGNGAPSLYNWFPELTIGTFTGQSQAAWDVTATADYVVMGGEFPSVNGTPQQGLVRFAKRSSAPRKQGPRLSGSSFVPTTADAGPGAISLTFPTNNDRDDMVLTYKVIRDGNTATPAYVTSSVSLFWKPTTLGFTDSGLVPGSAHNYRLQAVDPDGNVVNGQTVSATAPANPPPVNQPPTAAFTASVGDRTATLDGSTSTDPDGTISSYSWSYGDGSADGTGATTSHTYAAAGTFTVGLTVTDDAGATGSVSHTVTIDPPPPAAADDFQRTVTGDWGVADAGGAWSVSNGTKYSVDGQAGSVVMSTPGSGSNASLRSLSLLDTTGVVDLSLDKPATGGGVYLTLLTRFTGMSSYSFGVRVLADGTVTGSIGRTVSGNATNLATVTVPGLTVTEADVLRVRLAAVGSGTTALSLKVWKVGSTEPTDTAIAVSDSTAALQVPGAFQIQAYLSGTATNAPVTGRVDNLSLS